MTTLLQHPLRLRHRLRFALVAALLSALGHSSPGMAGADTDVPIITRMAPISFEANIGQFHESVQFAVSHAPYRAFIKGDALVLDLPASDASDKETGVATKTAAATPARVKLAFVGANSNARAKPGQELVERSHYFIGNDPKGWITDVPHYDGVTFSEVYPGVDVVYYPSNGKLEYDIVVQPHADLSEISLRVDGAERLELAASGDLLVHTAAGTLVQKKPLVHQTVAGAKQLIDTEYRLSADQQVRFDVKQSYDRSRPLVIDPILDFATIFGGGVVYVRGATVSVPSTIDNAGNLVIAGGTRLSAFPLVNPFQSTYTGNNYSPVAFVTKLNPLGTQVLYSTFLGGASGAFVSAVKSDAQGNLYITGQTGADFPTTPGTYKPAIGAAGGGGIRVWQRYTERTVRHPAFVAKLTSAGNALAYSTFLGGAMEVNGLALDAAGQAIVVGSAGGEWPTTAGVVQPIFPASAGHTAGFIAKLNAAGTGLVFSTYFGGPGGEEVISVEGIAGGDTTINAIALDAANNVYITGSTTATGLPVINPIQAAKRSGSDAFVAKLGPDASAVIYSTYLGGDGHICVEGDDYGTAIAVGPDGSAYVGGRTFSAANFPITTGRTSYLGFSDAFIAKLNSQGSALVYSTLLGGSANAGSLACGEVHQYGEVPTSLTVNVDGSLTVGGRGVEASSYTGNSAYLNFPLLQPVTLFGSGFITKLDPSGASYKYSIIFPSIESVAVNAFGDLYGVGRTWNFLTTGYPTLITPGAIQAANPGEFLVYVARIIRPGALVALSFAPTIAIVGEPLTITANLSSFGGEGGQLTFYDGNSLLGSVSVAAGANSATWTATNLEAGIRTFTARFTSALIPQGVGSVRFYVPVSLPDNCN